MVYYMSFDILILDKKGMDPSFWGAKELMSYGVNTLFPRWKKSYTIEEILNICSKNNIKVIIPISISDHLFIARHKDILQSHGIKFLVNDFNIISIISNKASCFPFIVKNKWFNSKNIPNFEVIHNYKEFCSFCEQAKYYPLWIKGPDKFRFKPLYSINEVDENEINTLVTRYNGSLLIQENINGNTCGYFCLAKEGTIIIDFTHIRIREVPLSGGSCVYASSKNDKELLKIGRSFIKQSNWTGLVMLEFKKNINNNNFELVEINPKFWGTYALTTLSNHHFFYAYYQYLTNSFTINFNEKIKEIKVYYPIRELVIVDNNYLLKNRLNNIFKSINEADYSIIGSFGDKKKGKIICMFLYKCVYIILAKIYTNICKV